MNEDKVRQIYLLMDQIAGHMKEIRTLLEDEASTAQPVFLLHVGENGAIPAMKLVREITGWGLKESKELTDRVRAGQPQMIPCCYKKTEAMKALEITYDVVFGQPPPPSLPTTP